MKLTPEEARSIVYEDHPDWELVKGTDHPVKHRRWTVDYEGIFLHKPSNTFYGFSWPRGVTESQEVTPYEYCNEVEVPEVVWKEVTVKQWVRA